MLTGNGGGWKGPGAALIGHGRAPRGVQARCDKTRVRSGAAPRIDFCLSGAYRRSAQDFRKPDTYLVSGAREHRCPWAAERTSSARFYPRFRMAY